MTARIEAAEAPARRTLALLSLLHPVPVAITVLAGGAFAFVAARGSPPLDRLALFLVSLLLTQCSISALNDYCDRDLDRTAKPWRAIPAGAISAERAKRLAAGLFIFGGLALGPLGVLTLALGLIGTWAGFAYSLWLKRTPWSWVPFWVGFPTLVLWAFAAVERFDLRLLSVYVVGLPIVVAIHLADALPDVEVDRAAGAGGLAAALGPPLARLVCGVCLFAAVAIVLAIGVTPWLLPALGLSIGAVVVRGRAHWFLVAASGLAIALAWLGASLP